MELERLSPACTMTIFQSLSDDCIRLIFNYHIMQINERVLSSSQYEFIHEFASNLVFGRDLEVIGWMQGMQEWRKQSFRQRSWSNQTSRRTTTLPGPSQATLSQTRPGPLFKTHLLYLNLSRNQHPVTPSFCTFLTQQPQIHTLILTGCIIERHVTLEFPPNLRVLDISRARGNFPCELAGLRRLKQPLREINVSRCNLPPLAYVNLRGIEVVRLGRCPSRADHLLLENLRLARKITMDENPPFTAADFANLRGVQSLSLRRMVLNEEMLMQLRALVSLKMDIFYQRGVLREESFSNLRRLRKLSLTVRPWMPKIPGGWDYGRIFMNFRCLESLSLNQAPNEMFCENVFRNLRNLRILTIQNANVAETCPPDIFSNLNGIHTIRLVKCVCEWFWRALPYVGGLNHLEFELSALGVARSDAVALKEQFQVRGQVSIKDCIE